MHKYYEDAAHLLLLMHKGGCSIAPWQDVHSSILGIAGRLERILVDLPRHADAAMAIIDEYPVPPVDSKQHKRLVALAGTYIANFITRERMRR